MSKKSKPKPAAKPVAKPDAPTVQSPEASAATAPAAPPATGTSQASETPPAAENPPTPKTTSADAAPRKRKARVLAEAKRDGKTVRVMTDDIRVWKETD